jgi:GTP-binding protein EngB required for normal cell division
MARTRSSIFRDRDDYEAVYKIALVGDSGVGKSALLLQFIDQRFVDTDSSTFGVDMVRNSVSAKRVAHICELEDLCYECGWEKGQITVGRTSYWFGL